MISNFKYSADTRNYIGLFSQVGDGARIKDIILDNVEIEVEKGSSIGALVGFNFRGIISSCCISGSIIGGDGSGNLGALVGFNSWGTVSNCSASGSVTGAGTVSSIGGLVGNNAHGNIYGCTATITVSGGPGSSDIGGLVGYSEAGTISNSYAAGNVSGEASLGGLVGYKNDGSIIQSYAIGDVNGNTRLGGLVGRNDSGIISDCYATGSIDGDDALGGLVGRNHKGSISYCYAAGTVNGNSRFGGLVGNEDRGSYISSFWDSDANPGLTGAGDIDPDPNNIIGKTTTEMQMASTFLEAGWDFMGETVNGTEDIWKIAEGVGYPCLWWEKYCGGTGEPNNPYQIATAEDLITLGETPEDYDKNFVLTSDIDLDPNLPGRKVFDMAVIAQDFNDASPWFEDTPFTGVFNGNGHTISNLTIIGKSNLGLFGLLEYGAKISNLGLEELNVNGTGNCVGGLVGENSGGIIVNCYTNGNINGSWYVGGLTGDNSLGTVAYCYSIGTVSGESWIGGLVGFNESEITNCYAASKVLGTKLFGGLAGYSESMFSVNRITNSYFLVARDDGGPDNGYGFPLTDEQMKKSDSFIEWDFIGKTDGPDDIWVEPVEGGYPILWWQLSPLPELPFSNGKGKSDDPYLISMADELNSIGHNPRLMAAHFKVINDIDLVGVDFFIIGSEIFPFSGVFNGNDHTISNFNHTIKYDDFVGLFGYVQNPKTEIKDLGLINPNINHAIGDVGSLVGYFGDGTVSNCYAEGGSVNGYGNVGGLVGSTNGSITNCHSNTTVSGMNNIGGLVGSVVGLRGLFSDKAGSDEYTGTISNCYSTGSVSGDRTIGGLVGNNYFGHMMNCYARANVTGNVYVGGLVGSNYEGSIWLCYSASNVIGTEKVGGLVGENTLIPNQQGQNDTGIISGSFWDMETSGQMTSDGGMGLTTIEMQTAITFLKAGWDFVGETENGTEDIWWINEGQDYPRLWWEAE